MDFNICVALDREFTESGTVCAGPVCLYESTIRKWHSSTCAVKAKLLRNLKYRVDRPAICHILFFQFSANTENVVR